MATKKTRRKKKIIYEVLNAKCPFCEKKLNPDYKDNEKIKEFITDRAKIMPSARSGVCSKHQRLLKLEIKRARYLALLPLVERL